MRRAGLLLCLVVVLLAAMPGPAAAQVFPEVVPLPDGFQPEGIASGYGTAFYVGSLVNGAIYAGDVRTGLGDILVAGQEGRSAAGLAFDERSGYLFVAGALTGMAYVYDTRTGAEVAAFSLTAPGGFINDVIVTREAAYLTSSFEPVVYRVPLEANGRLPGSEAIQPLTLSGDWTQVPGAFVFNANGIEATPNGKTLIVVNSTVGALYRVDPRTGAAEQIDLGGGSVPYGDGLLLDGRTLYVVQNRLNQIAVVELSADLGEGEVVGTITDPDFRVPTTIAELGASLYAVNARFDVENPGPETEYEVVRVPK